MHIRCGFNISSLVRWHAKGCSAVSPVIISFVHADGVCLLEDAWEIGHAVF